MLLSAQNILWYCIAMVCVIVSVYQIWELANEWSNWPITTIEEMVPKQKIPFPSITICPEGETLYPALETYLNGKNLDYREFPTSVTAYLRIQLEVIHFYFSRLPDNSLKVNCNFGKKDAGSFCAFFLMVKQSIDQKVAENLIKDQTLQIYQHLKNNFFLLYEGQSNNFNDPFLNNLQSNFKKLRSGSLDNLPSLVNLYSYLAVMKVLMSKAKLNSLDVMSLFLEIIKKNDLKTVKKHLTNSTIIFPSFKEDTVFEPSLTRPPTLPKNFKTSAEKLWQKHLKKEFRSNLTTCCSMANQAIYRQLYIVYMQLLYLQTSDLSRNLGSRITQLEMYPSYEELPLLEKILSTVEIDKGLAKIAKSELKMPNVTWSIKHLVKYLITQGENTILQNVGTLDVTIEELTTALQGNQAECNQTIFPILCKQLVGVTELPRHQELLELLHNTAHPPLSTDRPASSYITSALPFCFTGVKISEVLGSLHEFKNYAEEEINYKFCTEAQHVYTDRGLCTTINFAAQAELIASDFLPLKKEGQAVFPTFQPKYPFQKVRNKFHDGFILILDSGAFSSIVSRNRDVNNVMTQQSNTILESRYLNNFKIILHNKNELPTQLLLKSVSTDISKSSDVSDLQAFFAEISVEVIEADESIRDISVAKRKCRFEDETYGLKMFKLYSENNCLYECQLLMAKDKCGCTPWNFPRRQSDRICDPFGNFCFNNHLLWLYENLHTIKNIGSPPCGCYTNCRTYRYKFAKKKVGIASNWLNTDELYRHLDGNRKERRDFMTGFNHSSAYSQFYNNYTVLDFDMARYHLIFNTSLNQYLTPYLLDTISPKQSNLLPERETLGQLRYLYKNSTRYLDVDKIRRTLLSDRVKNLAVFHLDFDNLYYNVRTKIKRMTMANMLSSFGGILGLYTGFNMLMLVDVIIWMRKFFKKSKSRVCKPCLEKIV